MLIFGPVRKFRSDFLVSPIFFCNFAVPIISKPHIGEDSLCDFGLSLGNHRWVLERFVMSGRAC